MLVPDRTQDMKKRTGALPYILRGIPLYYSTVASRVELRPTADLPTRHSERPLIVVCCLCARASANCSQPSASWGHMGPPWLAQRTVHCGPALTPRTGKLLRNKIRAALHAANSSNRREQTVKRVTSHDFF